MNKQLFQCFLHFLLRLADNIQMYQHTEKYSLLVNASDRKLLKSLLHHCEIRHLVYFLAQHQKTCTPSLFPKSVEEQQYFISFIKGQDIKLAE